MNRFKKLIFLFIFCGIIYYLFKNNYLLITSVNDAVYLWLNKVFPFLFIMFIINDIIINTNLLDILNGYLASIFNKIFHTSSSSVEAFILSIFSGTPSSAFIILEKLNNKSINIDDANKLIAFTFFVNPLFLYNILSSTFNTYIALKIIIIHYLTNIIIGLLFRGKINNNTNNFDNIKTKENIFILLTKAINKSFNTLLMILGTITFYMILTNLITNIISFNNLSNFLIKGLLEITQALNILNKVNYPSILKEMMAIFIISFGGMSIHSQVLAIINNTKIKYCYFLIGRILHALISTTIYFFITIATFS